MSVCASDVIGYMDSLFADYACPEDYSRNGEQVQGIGEIKAVAFAVDVTLAGLEAAAKNGAGLYVCHHGLFWGAGMTSLTGVDYVKIRCLMKNDMALYAMHLPLDAHREIGHNAKLAELVGMEESLREPFCFEKGQYIGCVGNLAKETSAGELAVLLNGQLETECRLYGVDAERRVGRVAIVSGMGDSAVQEAVARKADVLVTGELRHQYGLLAQELGIGVVVAGHYATETLGLKALMDKIELRFPELNCFWLNAPTGL